PKQHLPEETQERCEGTCRPHLLEEPFASEGGTEQRRPKTGGRLHAASQVVINARLPIRVTVMAFDEVVDAFEVLVEQVVFQIVGLAFQHDVLVDFDIAGVLNVFGFELFKASQPVFEETQVPARVPAAVFDPLSEKDELAVDVISISPGGFGRRAAAVQYTANFVLQLRSDAFVGVEQQYPFVFERQILEGPVLL